MDVQYYYDEDNFKVEIGTIVQYNEYFCSCVGNGCKEGCKEFMVVRLPDHANMVEMVQVHAIWDEDGTISYMRLFDPIEVISVEPYKIGAI